MGRKMEDELEERRWGGFDQSTLYTHIKFSNPKIF